MEEPEENVLLKKKLLDALRKLQEDGYGFVLVAAKLESESAALLSMSNLELSDQVDVLARASEQLDRAVVQNLKQDNGVPPTTEEN